MQIVASGASRVQQPAHLVPAMLGIMVHVVQAAGIKME